MKDIGKIISKYRKQKGLTQEQLGKQLNVSSQAISKWENNLSQPDIETIQTMVDIFGVSISEFFDNDDSITPQASSYNNRNSEHFSKKIVISLISALAALVLILSLIVFLVPIKLSSNEIYKKVDPAVFCIKADGNGFKQSGTGFFIDKSGTAVTNYHVIKNCIKGEVQLNNGKVYKISKIIGCDEDRDIAIIKVDVKSSKAVKLGNSDKIKVGDTVYAIGYPQSFALGSADSTLTQGIISKTRYTVEKNSYIQTTADMTHGNSGGVLVNTKGQVIGITTGMLSVSNEDYINMAIPINALKNVKRKWNCSLEEYFNSHISFSFYSNGVLYKQKKTMVGERIEAVEITRTGYLFNGWYRDIELTTLFDFSKPVGEYRCCYAKWTPINYTIKFKGNGGEGWMNDIVATYDNALTLPEVGFVNNHYIFMGWEVENKELSFADKQIVKNLTSTNGDIISLVATWEIEKYTMSFNENGADSGSMDSILLEYGQTINLPANQFSRTGYIFNGWIYKGKTYQDEEEITNLGANNEHIIFVADWEPITYFIEFQANNGSNAVTRQTIKYDQTVKLNENTFTNLSQVKVFNSWLFENGSTQQYFSDQQEISNLTTVNNSTLIFKAYWEPFYYIIKYDTNGGEGTFRDEKVVRHSLHYFPYNTPKKTGYTFSCWKYDELTIGNYHRMENVDFGIDVKPIEVVFVAQYQPNTYNINYYEKHTSDGQYINLLGFQQMTYDVAAKLRDDFTIPGRKIKAWEKISYNGSYYSSITLSLDKEHINLTSSGTINLVAEWIGVKFDIVYHNLKGPDDETTTTRRIKYSESWEATSSINSVSSGATAHGYVFTGWTFNDVFYADGTKIYYAEVMKVEENGTYHLYANWKNAPTCTIEFYANGGEGEMQTVIVYTNERYYLPECLFTKEGYTFRFWSINKECDVDNPNCQDFNRYEPNYDISFAIKAGETITLWANWLQTEESA